MLSCHKADYKGEEIIKTISEQIKIIADNQAEKINMIKYGAVVFRFEDGIFKKIEINDYTSAKEIGIEITD